MPPDIKIQNLGHLGLLSFLKHARHNFLPTIRNGVIVHNKPIYVIGNQSADLDSMISAIVYSYFFSRIEGSTDDNGNNDSNSSKRGCHYVPLINLPHVPSGAELRRLRPEFACALELAVSPARKAVSQQDNNEGKGKKGGDGIVQLLKEHILTVADLREGLLSSGAAAAEAEIGNGNDAQSSKKLELDCVLVDWNSLPYKIAENGEEVQGKGSIYGLEDLVTFSVSGCIDHHVDEGFVPPSLSSSSELLLEGRNPRVIVLGPGSCTSLVIREIRQRGLWPSVTTSSSSSSVDNNAEIQLAKLALAAILIDTTNLTAEGKVTDVDRDAVSFLTVRIPLSAFREGEGEKGEEWNQDSFFKRVQYAKSHSLDWLTIDEILDRDYKDWTESSSPSGEDKIVIGIASLVRPLKWITSKSRDEAKEEGEGSEQYIDDNDMKIFLNKLKKFADQKHLDVVSVMTAYNSEDEDDAHFARELLIWSLNEKFDERLQRFADAAKEELDLQKWNDFPIQGRQEDSDAGLGRLFIWRQGNIAKSRKQVAPLLRDVFINS